MHRPANVFISTSLALFNAFQVTFFEFLRSLAALGVHDSGAHVAGFAPSTMSVGGTYHTRENRRSGSRGLRSNVGRRSASRRYSKRWLVRSGSSGSEYDEEEEDGSTGDGDDESFSGGDDYSGDDRCRARRREGREGGGVKRARYGGGGKRSVRESRFASPKTRRGGVGDEGRPTSASSRRSPWHGRGRRSESSQNSEDNEKDGKRVEHTRKGQQRQRETSPSRDRKRKTSSR